MFFNIQCWKVLESCVVSGINKNVCADKSGFDVENCGNHIVEKQITPLKYYPLHWFSNSFYLSSASLMFFFPSLLSVICFKSL